MDFLYHFIARHEEKPRSTLAGPPPGVTPNFINPPSRGHEMVGVSISMIILTLAATFCRIYTRTFITKVFDWTDYLAIGAALCAIARTVCNCVAVYSFGLGRHIWDVPPSNFASIRNLQFIMDMVYLWGIMFAKFSILLLYAKIFHIQRKFRWFCYLMMFITFGYCISFFFIYAFNCKPVYYTWHFDLMHDDCIEITHIKMAIGGANILTDFVIMVMPLPLVLKLHLGRAQKIGLMLVFSTGIFVLITTIVREAIVIRTAREFDQPWTVSDEVIWLTIELNIGIVCVTLPVLAPIWRGAISKNFGFSYISNWFSSMRSSRGQSKISESDSESPYGSSGKDNWSAQVNSKAQPLDSHSDQLNLMEIRVKREITQV